MLCYYIILAKSIYPYVYSNTNKVKDVTLFFEGVNFIDFLW